MTPSPTHDSEDWLRAELVKMIHQFAESFKNGGEGYDFEPHMKAILAHYARPTKAQLELAAKVATLEQKIYMMESTYLKPEDVERTVTEAEERGMRKVLDLKRAKPCPSCNDIALIPNDDIGTICVKCKATYPF